jgi:molybdopterin biosynthesis enzyme
VRLLTNPEGVFAEPVPGKSASLSTLSKADGFIIIEPGNKPLEQGAQVTVFLFP